MAVEILSETPINTYELKEDLAKIKKRDKELNFRAQKTEEHLAQAASHKNAKELFDKINKLKISRLREQQIHKIVDVLPATVKDLKVVLQGYTVSVSQENMKKIVDIINKTVK
jgi:DNA-directed RNA polymerase subunit F|tara:strand:+ start:204 stop:542 length:339 start_codon:yes stop_codon:yes gene_type:complete